MLDRELSGRAAIRLAFPKIKQVVDESDIEEEEYQCGFCKTLAYLSQVRTIGKPEISCLDHVHSLPPGPKRLRLRFSDAEFKAMFARVKSRSDKWDSTPDDNRGSLNGTRKRKPSSLAALAMNAGTESESEEEKKKLAKRIKLSTRPPPGAVASDGESSSSDGDSMSEEEPNW